MKIQLEVLTCIFILNSHIRLCGLLKISNLHFEKISLADSSFNTADEVSFGSIVMGYMVALSKESFQKALSWY